MVFFGVLGDVGMRMRRVVIFVEVVEPCAEVVEVHAEVVEPCTKVVEIQAEVVEPHAEVVEWSR